MSEGLTLDCSMDFLLKISKEWWIVIIFGASCILTFGILFSLIF